jgi:hypothetical protein
VRVLVVALSQDLLARLALGLQDTPAANAVLRGMWRGADTYVDLSRDAGPCENAALGAMYASYADRLRDMGAKPLVPGQYLAAILGSRGDLLKLKPSGPEPKPPSPEDSEGRTKKIVITEKDVLAFWGSKNLEREDQKEGEREREWVLPRNALVTALAKEAAEKRKIVLRKSPPGSAGEE